MFLIWGYWLISLVIIITSFTNAGMAPGLSALGTTFLSFVAGALIGSLLTFWLTRPRAPWALVASGTGSRAGLNVSGLFNTDGECEILKKLHLQKPKVFIDQKEEKDLVERDGLLLRGDRWYAATCLPLDRLPTVSTNLTDVSAALSDIASTVSSR